MALATFLGAGPYGYRAAQRPREPRAPTGPENQDRYARALKGIGRNPYVCTIPLDADGNATEEAIMAAVAKGCLEGLDPRTRRRIKLPDGAPGVRPPPPPGVAPAPTAPEYLTAQMLQFLGIGPNSRSDFATPIGRPCVLERIVFEIDAPDPGNQNLQPMIRYGNDTTDGVQPGDFTVWTQTQDISTLVGLFSTANRATALTLDFQLPILTSFFMPHMRLINNSGASTLQVSSHWVFRVIPPEELSFYAPPPISPARALAGTAYGPKPSKRTKFQIAGFGEAGLDQYSKLELLADDLRGSPFGILHSEMILRAGMAGFRDPERAVALAIRMAARPPNFQLLASRI